MHGQAQKETFVNETHSLTDALLHCTVEGTLSAPPASPVDGESWLVGTGASGEWLNHDVAIACRQAENWLFVTPQSGMRIFDRSTAQIILFNDGWQAPDTPNVPAGGTTIDAEARSAIADLIVKLQASGVFPDT